MYFIFTYCFLRSNVPSVVNLTPGNNPLIEASVVIMSFVFHFSINVNTRKKKPNNYNTNFINRRNNFCNIMRKIIKLQTSIYSLIILIMTNLNGLTSKGTKLTVFRFVDYVFGFQIGVYSAGSQMLCTAGFDLHVLVGLQVQF